MKAFLFVLSGAVVFMTVMYLVDLDWKKQTNLSPPRGRIVEVISDGAYTEAFIVRVDNKEYLLNDNGGIYPLPTKEH